MPCKYTVSYTHLDVYKRQLYTIAIYTSIILFLRLLKNPVLVAKFFIIDILTLAVWIYRVSIVFLHTQDSLAFFYHNSGSSSLIYYYVLDRSVPEIYPSDWTSFLSFNSTVWHLSVCLSICLFRVMLTITI